MKKFGILEYLAPDWSAHKNYYRSIDLEGVGYEWFDCLTDDQQNYVLQMQKYDHLDYDEVIKQYDKDILPALIKHQKSLGWNYDNNGNFIGSLWRSIA